MNHQHLSIDAISDYLAEPTATEFDALRRHLISCSECREQASLVSRLRDKETPLACNQSLTEDDELHIADYLEGRMSANQDEEIAKRLASDKQAQKAALHYATSRAAMRRVLGDSIGSAAVAERQQGDSMGLVTAVTRFFNWRPLAWISAPAVAALTLLVAVIVYPAQQNSVSAGLLVATYQDHAVVTFNQQNAAQPGIGFFSAAKKTEQPFAKMDVTVTNDHALLMRWSPIVNSENYRLKLFVINDNQRSPVGEVTSETPAAVLEGFIPRPGSRYEWALSGQTSDGFLFSTKGGFVFNVQN